MSCARENACPGWRARNDEQPVLGRREVQVAAAAAHGGARAVDDDVAHVEDVGLCRGELAVGSPQERADPREQLAHAVRLGEVVVGAHLEPEHLVELVGLHREHEDGLTQAELAHLPTEVEAGAVGKPHVEHDETRRLVARPCHARRTGRLPVHVVSLVADAFDEALGDGGIVLDHEDV